MTALARILTGWTFAGHRARIGEPGVFTFFANAHEPGRSGACSARLYRAGGIEQGEAALADLARHPATARAHRDQARRPLRGRRAARPHSSHGCETCLQDTDGDLKALASR